MITFQIEAISPHHIHGWAYDSTPGAGRVEVTVPLLDGCRKIEASLFRKHLQDAGKGDGKAGFVLYLGRGERFDPRRAIIFRSGELERSHPIPLDIQRALAHDIETPCFLSRSYHIFQCVLVLIIKNEARYVEEWIEYHRILGVDHVMIFDNGSTDSLRLELSRYVSQGFVTVIDWPNLLNATLSQRRSGWLEQDTAYACATRILAGKAKWMGCLDVDEFVVFEGGEKRNITEFLDSFNEPIVTLFWRLFGTSGIDEPNDKLVIEQFTRRGHDAPHRASKVFVRPEKVHHIINAHRFAVGDSRVTAHTTDRKSFFGIESVQATYRAATIHHYHTRSRREFMQKVQRGWPANDDNKNFNWEDHFKKHDRNDVVDVSAVNLADEVKLRIERSRAAYSQPLSENQLVVAPNWLLDIRPTLLCNIEAVAETNGVFLDGYVLDLLEPNVTHDVVLHDGYGTLLGNAVCNAHSQTLSMNRISNACHGFRVRLLSASASFDQITVSTKNFVKVLPWRT